MAKWIRQATGIADHNNTSNHVIAPTGAYAGVTPSAGGTLPWTPVSGRFQVVVVAGPSSNTLTTNTGTGWFKAIQSGSTFAEISIFTKTASGTNDWLSVQHGISDTPLTWIWYEFNPGTSLHLGNQESYQDNTFNTLSGLNPPELILAMVHRRPITAAAVQPTVAISGNWTNNAELWQPTAPSGYPDGAYVYSFYQEDYLGSTVTPSYSINYNGASDSGDWATPTEKLILSLNVAVTAPVVWPSPAVFQLSGKTSTITAPQRLTPNKPTLALSGFAPGVGTSNARVPTAASLTISGKVPLVFASGPKIVSPSAGQLRLNPLYPTVSPTVTPTTVLTLDPAFFDILENDAWFGRSWLEGEVIANRTIKEVNYPNNPLFAVNYSNGAAALNTALLATSGKKIVFGHSMGAQVAAYWLRVYGPYSAIPPADLEFILTGNPERKYGGVLMVPNPPAGTKFLADDDGPGIPEDTVYQVTDFARQYDSYADYPNVDKPSLLARNNVKDSIHNDYYHVRLSDPANTTVVEGNIRYMLSPTSLWWQPEYNRKKIEESYIRPVQAPQPPPPPVGPPTEEEFDFDDLINLRDDITDVGRLAEVAESLIPKKKSLEEEVVIRVHDFLWREIQGVGDDMMELSGTDPRNNLPSATLKVKGDSPLIPIFFDCEKTLVGITVETGGLRFAYYVDTFDYTFENGEWTGTANLLGVWDILNYLQIWPEWYLPIQAQPISHAFYIWAICTAIEAMVSEQAFRIQTGMWEFFNNALSLNLDVRAWFGALLQSNGSMFDMLRTPIYVVRTNPFLDTSPLIARTVRMESCGTVIQDVTRAYGIDVRVDLWLPGDAQPDKYAKLTKPTYVVTAKDRSQIEGPTKTVADSVIRTVVDLGASFHEGEVKGLIKQVPGMSGVYYSPLLGVNYNPPWAILTAPDPGEKGSVLNCKITAHTPKGWQHIVGGRSPKWLNDLMNATYAWIIDSISILIGFTGIPSNLLEGFLNNAFLAFQIAQSYERRDSVGPYHPGIEVMHPTASSPYNVETVFAFINALWDSRGYVSAQATFRNGEVLTLGKDVFRGGLISVLYMGGTRLFTDYIENVMFRFTPTERDIMIQVGDGKAEEAPLAKHQRFITGVIESINVVTLAPQSG